MGKIHFDRAYSYLKSLYKSSSKRIISAGGFPHYPNLGDVTLYKAYEKIFSEYDFVHYQGGRLSKIPTQLLKPKAPSILGGGTLINRQCLHSAKECSDLFENFYVFGTGLAQSSFWETTDNWQDTMHLWKPILDKAKYVGVRGPLSLQILKDHDIKAEMIGDPVLVYAEEEDTDTIDYVNKTIGINLGGSEGKVWGSEESIAYKYVEIAKRLKSDGFDIHWFVVWGDDLAITKKAAELSNTTDNIHCIYHDYEEYFSKVRKMSVFMGLKLHAVVMAHCMYVPSIMIEYRPKCRDYMLSVDQGEYNFSSGEFDIDNIVNLLHEFNENRKEYSKKLYDSMRPLCTKQLKKAQELIASWGK